MRRLLGRVGWPVVFFLVAGLVFAGLGWVTYSALGVEQAQREAAARAELGNNLRVALWRLDGRMLPTLGVEDSRPFYHYESIDPNDAFCPAATPLLTATLPDWMQLHFQLDPAGGWVSSQAPGNRDEAERMRAVRPELLNFFGGREAVLADVKAKFPARMTCDLFAARDRDIPADSLPFAAPLFTEVNNESPAQPQVPEATPKPPPPADPVSRSDNEPTPDTARVLGYELCLRAPEQPGAQQQPLQQQEAVQVGNGVAQADNSLKKNNEQGRMQTQQKAVPQGNNVVMRGGRSQKDAETERGWIDYLKRAQVFSKGLEEAKNAYGDNQLSRNPLSNYSQNTTPLNSTGPSNNDPRPPGAPGPQPQPPTATAPVPTAPAVPTPGPAAPGIAPGAGPTGPPGGPPMKESKEKDAGDERSQKQQEATGGALGVLGIEAMRAARRDIDRLPGAGGDLAKKPAPRPDAGVPPGEDRPPAALPVAPAAGAAPPAVHLGSMRPQWVTGPDGSEVLMLVRAARLEYRNPAENKTVYQGVVIDWPRLEATLKDEVKDLFPDARLVPVKDPEGVSPGRAMTALPVQLDVGPEPALPPAGWTPLRIGIVLAWAATLIAVVAVGFSGWSLIDLAERRIRFVSAVTHELRTPLTSLRLYLDLLVSGMIRDEAKRQEYLSTLAVESERLHRLVDNVLDFAKLEKRRKSGDVKPVKVCELVGQLRETWADRVAQDGKELVVISTLPAECEVPTDPAMIQQIVGNLIDNARKYSRDAEDRRIWLWAKPGQGKGVVVEVEDRGEGVPAGERRSIFKPFRRGEQADSKAGGAGLGLALAKSWAEVLGARLTYRPAEGGTGACFRLELPGK